MLGYSVFAVSTSTSIVFINFSADSIAEDSEKHINSQEVILTIGKSRTVEAFLKRAAKSRKFEVIIVKCGPLYQVFDKLCLSIFRSSMCICIMER